MPSEYCFGALCFVPLMEPSPGIFGLQQFVPGLALMVLAWTTADARYRFRVASAALPVRTITFAILAIVGPLTLLTSLWHAQHWLVPRGNLLTPAGWQAILGGAFIGTFFLWAWVAFVRPPVVRFATNREKLRQRDGSGSGSDDDKVSDVDVTLAIPRDLLKFTAIHRRDAIAVKWLARNGNRNL